MTRIPLNHAGSERVETVGLGYQFKRPRARCANSGEFPGPRRSDKEID
jgi:hypothetical protein